MIPFRVTALRLSRPSPGSHLPAPARVCPPMARYLLCLAVSLLFFAAHLHAQTSPAAAPVLANVQGIVVGPEGHALSGARVAIRTPGNPGDILADTLTDVDG